MTGDPRYVVFEEYGVPVYGHRCKRFITEEERSAAREKIYDAFGLSAEEREFVRELCEREQLALEDAERQKVSFLGRLRAHVARIERELLEQIT